MEKLVSENPKLQKILKEIELLDKNLGIALKEHDKHRTDMKRKKTYPAMVASYEKFKEAKKKYIDKIENIPIYQLHLICEARVDELENQIKTSFAQYIEENIAKPTRWLKQKQEHKEWLLFLINQTKRNKLAFSRLYKKQYEKLRNLYFNMKQIQDILVDLNYPKDRLDKLKSEMEEFQKKYKRFKEEDHYFT